MLTLFSTQVGFAARDDLIKELATSIESGDASKAKKALESIRRSHELTLADHFFSGYSYAHEAARQGQCEILNLIVDRFPDLLNSEISPSRLEKVQLPESISPGDTILSILARSHKNGCLMALLTRSNINPNAGRAGMDRPIHVALKSKNTEGALAIMSHSQFDFTVLDQAKKNLFDLALETSDPLIVEAVLKKNPDYANPKLITDRTVKQDLDFVKSLIQLAIVKPDQYEWDIFGMKSQYQATNVNGYTINLGMETAYPFNLLHFAIAKRLTKIVTLLLSDKNLDPSLHELRNGRTPLQLAIQTRDTEIINALLNDSRVDVNQTSKAGFVTEFREATIWGRKDVIIEEQWTALHFAVTDNFTEGVQLLLSHPKINKNPTSVTRLRDMPEAHKKLPKKDRGKTPFGIAKNFKFKEIQKILE